MAHHTAWQLGLIILLTCLTAQVVSQVTMSPNMTAANHTVSHVNSTVATTRMTTAPAGAAYQLHSSSVFVLMSGTISTMLLIHQHC